MTEQTVQPPSDKQIFHVGILIFDDVEVLDFAGPFEVFSVAGRLLDESVYQDGQGGLIRTLTIAQTERVIHARGNLLVQPHYTFSNHPALDLLVVPGGWGTRREADNPVLLEWLRKATRETPLNASVCTGAFLLGKIGLFDNGKATTHWASLDRLANIFPQIQVIRDQRWVDEGAVISSAGVSAGIDMCLHLVERLYGQELALRTARQMEYNWQPQLA